MGHQTTEFEKRGYVVIRGLLSADETAHYRTLIQELSGIGDADFRTKAFTCPDGATQNRPFWPVIYHERLLEGIRDLLGPTVRYTQHSDLHAHYASAPADPKYPGAWHRDSACRDFNVGPDWDESLGPYRVIRVALYLQSYAESHSELGVVPGSHLFEKKVTGNDQRVWKRVLGAEYRIKRAMSRVGLTDEPHYYHPWFYHRTKPARWPMLVRPAKPVWIKTEPGDCVIFNQRLYHSSSPIIGPKYAVFLSYSPEDEHARNHLRYYRYTRKDLKYSAIPPELEDKLREHDLFMETPEPSVVGGRGVEDAMSEVLTIIPARGGSKGILRKNVRFFLDKPLLVHSIEHAQQASQVTRVVVSTDDAEIATIARRHGAEVVIRPDDISGDTASSESALLHVLDHLKNAEGYEPDLVVFLQATSPLRRAGDLEAAIEMFEREKADSLFSGVPVHGFLWRLHEGRLSSISMDYHHRPRRQDVGEDFIENGSTYIFKPWVLREHKNRLGGKIVMFRESPLSIFQIDEPGDLTLLEKLAAITPPGPRAVDLHSIRFLVLDFDGVLTDNRVLVSETGPEAVWCHRGDGWGIARLKERGVKIIVISTETNPVVGARCRKLGLEFIQACDDKLAALERVVQEHGLSPQQVAYVGNDLNDLDCLRWVGLPIAVADAVPEIRGIARLVTSRPGGLGAVREVTDWLIAAHDGVASPEAQPVFDANSFSESHRGGTSPSKG